MSRHRSVSDLYSPPARLAALQNPIPSALTPCSCPVQLLDLTIANELKREHARRLEDGTLPTESVLRRCYEMFAVKLGLAALRRLDGVEVLEGLHLTSNKDNLVYWLEFK